jgi:hypothetical protein
MGSANDMATDLQFLDFEASDGDDGVGTFDAMASVSATQRDALLREVAQVLGWAHRAFVGVRGPVEEGGEWDYQLLSRIERSVDEGLDYLEASGSFSSAPGSRETVRHTLTLAISGSPGFCAAFRDRFGVD